MKNLHFRGEDRCSYLEATSEPFSTSEGRTKGINLIRKLKSTLSQTPFSFSFWKNTIDQIHIYQNFFPSTMPKVIKRVIDYNKFGLLAETTDFPKIPDQNSMLENEERLLLFETGLQGASLVCFLRMMSEKICLPHFIEHLEFFPDAIRRSQGKNVWIKEITGKYDSSVKTSMPFMKFDLAIAGEDDDPQMIMQGLEMVPGEYEPVGKNSFLTLGVPYLVGHHPFMGILVQDMEKLQQSREVLANLLCEKEIEKLNAFTIPKRREEWLAGRLALKLLIIDLIHSEIELDLAPKTFRIISEGNQPEIVLADSIPAKAADFLGKLKCSISHGGGIAIGVVGHSRIGTDVEAWRQLDLGVIKKFLSEDETALVPQKESVVLWTVKEAVCKAHGNGFGIGDLLKIKILSFGYNTPFEVEIPEIGKKFTCLTFKDCRWVVSIAVSL